METILEILQTADHRNSFQDRYYYWMLKTDTAESNKVQLDGTWNFALSSMKLRK